MAKKKAAKAKPVSKTVHHAKPKKNYTTLLIVVVAILAVIFFSLLYLRSAQKSEASSRGHEKSEGKEKSEWGRKKGEKMNRPTWSVHPTGMKPTDMR
jgi:hypothetical protein